MLQTHTPGKRVLINVDSGPGRMYPESQRRLRARGFCMFPGVPNGAEVGQEMDQLSAHLKTLCHRNREDLIKARTTTNQEDTLVLGWADVGWLIFGGKLALADGTSIELVPSFDIALMKKVSIEPRRNVGIVQAQEPR